MLSQAAPGASGTLEHRHVVWLPNGPHSSTIVQEYSRDGAVVTFLPPSCSVPGECVYAEGTGRLVGEELRMTFADPAIRDQVFLRLK